MVVQALALEPVAGLGREPGADLGRGPGLGGMGPEIEVVERPLKTQVRI